MPTLSNGVRPSGASSAGWPSDSTAYGCGGFGGVPTRRWVGARPAVSGWGRLEVGLGAGGGFPHQGGCEPPALPALATFPPERRGKDMTKDPGRPPFRRARGLGFSTISLDCDVRGGAILAPPMVVPTLV